MARARRDFRSVTLVYNNKSSVSRHQISNPLIRLPSPMTRKSLIASGAPLPNTLVLPHSTAIRRLVSRLSKDSLLELVLTWLDAAKVDLYSPDLTSEDEDEDDLTLDDVRETYEGFKKARNVKGKDVVERIVEREWRSGLNMLQIAELDYRCSSPPQLEPLIPS